LSAQRCFYHCRTAPINQKAESCSETCGRMKTKLCRTPKPAPVAGSGWVSGTFGTDRSITMEKSEPVASTRQVWGIALRTLPAAISRRAITISRLFDFISGLAPFKSCFARTDASVTSSKRLETLSKQSSTVILAMVITLGRKMVEHKDRFCCFAVLTALSATSLHNRQRSHGVTRNAPPDRWFIYFRLGQPHRRIGPPGVKSYRSVSSAPRRWDIRILFTIETRSVIDSANLDWF